MTTQLAGLASGFDWNAFVDTIMQLERAPISRIETEIVENTIESNSLLTLNTYMSSLQTAVKALEDENAFSNRTATLTDSTSTWGVQAAAGTANGTTTINVSKLATTARLEGASNRGTSLASTSDVSGVSLATMGTSITPTAGVFTINGAQVTVDLADSLQDVFTAINTATGGAVTASYNATTDQVELAGTGTIVLGAANDTSNFLAALRLNNNGTNAVASSGSLGALSLYATLDSGRFDSAITAVDGSGVGTFSINGVDISYDVDTDSLNAVLQRINDSTAGVTASYDSVADRVVLQNDVTGDIGIAVSETADGLMDALGLTGSATLVAGTNAEFTVNGGSTRVATSNTLGADQHGVTGLSITADATGTQTVTIAADTAGMRQKIDSFIEAFNGVQRFIESESAIVSSDGNVTTSTLSGNREVQDWATALRRAVFEAVPGLENSVSRLESMGIDFLSGTSELSVTDESKLTNALENNADDVATFFQQSSDGFVANLTVLLDNYLGVNGGDGQLETQRTNLADANKSLEQQIKDIERRLEQRRELLEASFIAMEQAQSKLQQMQTHLNNAFPSTGSSSGQS